MDTVTPLIQTLPTSLQALAARGIQRHFPKGTLLIHEGDRGDTLFILLSGRLRVYGSSAVADREVLYGYCEAGDYVGEMGLDGGERSANVVAMESSQCVVVQREQLLAHLSEHPEFALELLTKVIRRVRQATASLKSLALNDVYGRLKAVVDAEATPQPDGSRWLSGARTHRDWAAQLGCSREMVSRVMKDLERGGYVEALNTGLRVAKPLPARG
ncbi:MAG: Crp/Fnr family transcriptional regulator [Burkholderiales bacterium]